MAPAETLNSIASTTESRTPERNKVSNLRANNERKSNKPLFILHVGPSKTGTTTVQYFSQNNANVLNDANVYYLGHNGHNPPQDTHRLHTYCFSGSNYNPDECKRKWEEIERIVDYHHAKNHIVLLSEERFSYPRDEGEEEKYLWKHLVPLKEKWDVRVVYTYRRYSDWLVSKYYQVFNPKGGSRYDSNVEKRVQWPDMKGKVIPSFPQYFEAYNTKWAAKHPANMKKKFEKRFDHITYFNMHAKGEFLPRFFCEMLPEAPSLCEYLHTEYETIIKNPSTSKHVHYDMLAVEAYKRGWINKELARRDVAQSVEDYALEMGYSQMTDFPLDCLTQDQLDSLLEQSLSLEKESVPDFFASAEGETELRAGFNAAVEKKKFCTVDVDVVLDDPKWQKFFKTMRPETISVAPED